MTQYDSTADTQAHCKKVSDLMLKVAMDLCKRGEAHDASKFSDAEKPYFDIYTPKMRNVRFGSPEYQEYLKELKPALDHHYSHNDHHPEFFENRMLGMDLIQLLEYCCDCYASMFRSQDGNIENSLDVAQSRYGFNDDFKQILRNTLTKISTMS